MTIGIYSLYWWEQDLIYIGLSQTLETRKKDHFNDLVSNKHTNFKVQNTYNNYGLPEFLVLEYCSIAELPSKEISWTKEFNALEENGLCIVEPGIVGFGTNSNSSKYNRRTILKIFSMLYRTSGKYTYISSRLKVPISLIRDIKTGRTHIWLSETYPEKYLLMKNRGAATRYRENNCILVSPKGTHYTIIGSLLDFCSTQDCFKLNSYTSSLGIGKVLRKERKQYKGWKLFVK